MRINNEGRESNGGRGHRRRAIGLLAGRLKSQFDLLSVCVVTCGSPLVLPSSESDSWSGSFSSPWNFKKKREKKKGYHPNDQGGTDEL